METQYVIAVFYNDGAFMGYYSDRNRLVPPDGYVEYTQFVDEAMKFPTRDVAERVREDKLPGRTYTPVVIEINKKRSL